MAECKEIDSALNNLSSAVNKLNGRLNGIDGQLKALKNDVDNLKKNNGKNNQGDKNNALDALYKRVSVLESYCDSVEAIFRAIANILKPITSIFK